MSEQDKKTYKRETAWALILMWLYQVYSGNIEMVQVISPPVFVLLFSVLGMDWHSKQSMWRKE